MTTPAPRWDLSNVYPTLDSPEFAAAVQHYQQLIEQLEQLINDRLPPPAAEAPNGDLANTLAAAVDQFNTFFNLSGTLMPYVYSFITTDSTNLAARKQLSELEQMNVRGQNLSTRFQAWVGKLGPALDSAIAAHPVAQAHAFALREIAEQSRYLMGEAEESLAAELNVSGASAWGRLQGTITSQMTVDFELDGEVQKLPLPALINLHSHPDESVRRRAYEAEMQAFDTVREPLAACINGVKGTVNTLDKRRGREDALHSAIDDARMDRQSLQAMLDAMHDSFPVFRKYLQAKAARLCKEKLPWWDIYAPLGESKARYTFEEGRAFIVDNFARFSGDLADFAHRAFDHNWIDAEQRSGKRGGAFCMGVSGVQESRVLCNFDGTLAQVSTIAHELGHAYHNHCAYRAGKTPMQRSTPMTLAETASILCETIVMQAVLEQLSDPQDQLPVLETMLVNDTQVIVDIYSRYLFEKDVFEQRAKAELSADDLCELMEKAQKATYGDGLDERYLHKYMWTWKPHYYNAGLSFYNFPYAFGLLFGIGLYAIYQQRGEAFVADYQNLLASTGEASAADLCQTFGIDIRQRKFWDDSLAVIGQRIERFCAV